MKYFVQGIMNYDDEPPTEVGLSLDDAIARFNEDNSVKRLGVMTEEGPCGLLHRVGKDNYVDEDAISYWPGAYENRDIRDAIQVLRDNVDVSRVITSPRSEEKKLEGLAKDAREWMESADPYEAMDYADEDIVENLRSDPKLATSMARTIEAYTQEWVDYGDDRTNQIMWSERGVDPKETQVLKRRLEQYAADSEERQVEQQIKAGKEAKETRRER